jgi:hypothetical protein
MTAIQIVGLIAVVLFLGFAFFKLVRWTCAECEGGVRHYIEVEK